MGEERRPSIFFDITEVPLANGSERFHLHARCRFRGLEHGNGCTLEFPLSAENLSKQMECMRESLRWDLDNLQ